MTNMSPANSPTRTANDKHINNNLVNVVSPDNSDSGDQGFWMYCFGGLHGNLLPTLCGDSDDSGIHKSPNVVEVDVDFDAPSKLGLKASLKRVGSFRRSGSKEDLSVCSSSSVGSQNSAFSQYSQYSWRLRRRRQKSNRDNRDTRDPSPSLDYNGSYDRGDRKRESDIPLLIDPPSTRKRSRSVPLDRLLNSRKDRGAQNMLEPSLSVGGLRGKNLFTDNMRVEAFALKHDEVVTALIDDALENSSEDSSFSRKTSSNIYGSPIRRKLQGGQGSPFRKKIATPQWMRNRSRRSDDHSVCSRGSRVTNVNTADFFHSQCVLHKEKGSLKDSSQAIPSAVGREAALEKLKEKLSLLSEIESGKYGKGADMLRSDAVAFVVQLNGVEAVETRSIFTIRMGFVSMNYGIVLQWDRSSQLAKQVVLVKMCRDDFLERNPIEVTNSGGHTVITDSEIDEENSVISSVYSATDHSPGKANAGQAHLSVSILNVKQLVPKCDRHNKDGGFGWPWARGTSPDPKKRKSDHSDIRPYVRFVFGRNQHLTKSVKFNKGNITWGKRQRNSCLLPCPPEDQRWFVGQDDLIVEVRSRQQSSGDKSFFKLDKSSSHQKHKASDDPLLAAVTVPLSSIIFDEEDDNSTLDGGALSRVARFFKKRPSKAKDELPCTNITLPLPMKCCSRAPFGSISLRITMKSPATHRDTNPLSVPSVKHTPSPLRKRALQKKVDTRQQVEGIELLPLTSLISSWVNDDAAASKHKNTATMSKVKMWTKRYDPRTKKWSNVKWSNVNGSIKRSRSFKKVTKKKKQEDKPIIFQVVDKVMGKEEEKTQSLFNRSLHSVQEKKKAAGIRINETAHHVKESAGSRINEAVHQVRETKKAVGGRLTPRRMNERMHHHRRESAANRIARRR